MSFLGRAKKVDLLVLASEFGIEANASLKIPDLKRIIIESKTYEEDLAKQMLETIVEDRVERMREEEKDLERCKKDEDLERREKERRDELQRMRDELERLKSNQGSENEISKVNLDDVFVCQERHSLIPEAETASGEYRPGKWIEQKLWGCEGRKESTHPAMLDQTPKGEHRVKNSDEVTSPQEYPEVVLLEGDASEKMGEFAEEILPKIRVEKEGMVLSEINRSEIGKLQKESESLNVLIDLAVKPKGSVADHRCYLENEVCEEDCGIGHNREQFELNVRSHNDMSYPVKELEKGNKEIDRRGLLGACLLERGKNAEHPARAVKEIFLRKPRKKLSQSLKRWEKNKQVNLHFGSGSAKDTTSSLRRYVKHNERSLLEVLLLEKRKNVRHIRRAVKVALLIKQRKKFPRFQKCFEENKLLKHRLDAAKKGVGRLRRSMKKVSEVALGGVRILGVRINEVRISRARKVALLWKRRKKTSRHQMRFEKGKGDMFHKWRHT